MGQPNKNTTAAKAGAGNKAPQGKDLSQFTPQDALDALNLIMNGQEDDAKLTHAEAMQILDGVSVDDMQEATIPFFDWEKGTAYNILFFGIEKKEIKGKMNDVAIIEVDNERYLTGAAVFVNSVRNVTQLPAYVRVECKGKTKTAAGEYYDLSVFVLPTTK